jgi:hypothetical protein
MSTTIADGVDSIDRIILECNYLVSMIPARYGESKIFHRSFVRAVSYANLIILLSLLSPFTLQPSFQTGY